MAETLRDRWNRMTPDEKRNLAPSGRACVDCGEPAGTPWGPYWCPYCDDKRIERIDAGMRQIAEGFERRGAKERESRG